MREEVANMKMILEVNEIFGATVQGEGVSAGRRCAFLRLAGCNLTCSWCDTPYTWDWKGLNGQVFEKDKETHSMTVFEVIHKLTSIDVDLYVISGGEPMMQQEALRPVIDRLKASGKEVEIETNGTIKPKINPTRFNVSPKLIHSGVRDKIRFKPDTLKEYVGKGSFKFVCQNINDLNEVQSMITEIGIPNRDVWIMPEGRDPETLMSHATAITDEAIQRCWNITGRLHIMTWGAKRAV